MVVRRQVRRAASTPIHSSNPEIEELSRRLTALEKSLPDFSAQGVEVEFTAAGGGPLNVVHGLGRVPLGWIVLERSSPNGFFRLSTGSTTTVLALFFAGACSGRLWVY
jgi:hypothetical protein